MKFRTLRRVALSLAAWGLSTLASAQSFDKLVIFSSSLSDTGNLASTKGDIPAPYWKNRSTNGPSAVDILAAKLGTNADASLHLVGKKGGLNYSTRQAAAAGDSPIDLKAQVQAYLGPRNNVADGSALFFIFIGAHDIVDATVEQDEKKSEAMLTAGIAALDDAMRKLHRAGARYFYAPNNVDLGIAPIALQYKAGPRATKKTEVFNDLWELKLRALERELGVTVYRFDFFRFSRDLVAAGDAFGFTDVTTPCLSVKAPAKCDLDRYAFLNELLPSARIHDMLGNAMALALVEQVAAAKCGPARPCSKVPAASYSTIAMGKPQP